MSDLDLETVIEDAANDSVSPEPVDSASDTSVETTETETVETTESSQVAAPGGDQPTETETTEGDDFAKLYGIQPNSITGRENRIPYSRVKKIVERAEKEAVAKAQKAAEGGFTPKLQEAEAKIKDYEGRLQKVAQFENMIETQPQQFLQLLSTIPAYKEFFDYINKLAASGSTAEVKQESYLDSSTMPQPDETLSDGSKVYSLEGLAKRDEWLARQVEERAVRAAEERLSKQYGPMREQFEAEQRRQAAIPHIQKQLAEARTWLGFTDNEAAILEALKADGNLSLEGAYRQVVLPKLQSNRDEMRKSIIEELKKKPQATSVTTNATRPQTQDNRPKSVEEIIAEQARKLAGN